MAFEASQSIFRPNPSINILTKDVRKLSNLEVQRKQEKWLCYRCDEKRAPRHHYKKKELSVLNHDA